MALDGAAHSGAHVDIRNRTDRADVDVVPVDFGVRRSGRLGLVDQHLLWLRSVRRRLRRFGRNGRMAGGGSSSGGGGCGSGQSRRRCINKRRLWVVDGNLKIVFEQTFASIFAVSKDRLRKSLVPIAQAVRSCINKVRRLGFFLYGVINTSISILHTKTYSVNEFVADETTAHLRADQFESAGQIISRFVVVVLQLVQNL